MPLALIITMNDMPSDAEAVHNNMNTEENFLLAKLGDIERIDCLQHATGEELRPL